MAMAQKIKMLIKDFIDSRTVQAVEDFVDMPRVTPETINLIAKMFGYEGDFSGLVRGSEEERLLTSFKHNLTLLIQKTWVEKSDIALKEQILYQLETFYSASDDWRTIYTVFLDIISNAVYLMFGQQTKSDDFTEYSLRIDPEFGIFWNYIQNLPADADWNKDKYRDAVLLGMFFLANY